MTAATRAGRRLARQAASRGAEAQAAASRLADALAGDLARACDEAIAAGLAADPPGLRERAEVLRFRAALHGYAGEPAAAARCAGDAAILEDRAEAGLARMQQCPDDSARHEADPLLAAAFAPATARQDAAC